MTSLLLVLTLGVAAAASPPPAPPVDALPPEDLVLTLRQARIAGIQGDEAGQKRRLEEAVATHPDDATALAGALDFYQRTEPDAPETHALRSRLIEATTRPGGRVPLRLIGDLARDPKTTEPELARLLEILKSPPGEASARASWLRLRASVLERLGRTNEMLADIEELAGIDPDPALLWRLLRLYRESKRWQDVLRIAQRLRSENAWEDSGWFLVEAHAALGRFDELEKEAGIYLDKQAKLKLPDSPASADLRERNAERFFPAIFLLIDAGHREQAEKLLAQVEDVSHGSANVHRLRVMLFGTPPDRTALLAASAKASLGSTDTMQVRIEADRRLMAKDSKTAYDLYRHVLDVDPDGFGADASGWFNYGLAASELERWDDVESAMTRALAIDPGMSRALAQRARARVMKKDFARGIEDAQKALELDPKCKQACYALYLAYHTLGVDEKAAEWLKRYKAP